MHLEGHRLHPGGQFRLRHSVQNFLHWRRGQASSEPSHELPVVGGTEDVRRSQRGHPLGEKARCWDSALWRAVAESQGPESGDRLWRRPPDWLSPPEESEPVAQTQAELGVGTP